MGEGLRTDKFGGPGWVGPQCHLCRHLVADGFAVCPAFPGSIPPEITANVFDHRKPHPDEAVPVRFEPRDDVSFEALATLDHHFRPD